MKFTKYFSPVLFAAALLFAVGMTSCSEEIVTGKPVDESPYEEAGESYGFIERAEAARPTEVIELRSVGFSTDLHFGLTKPLNHAVDATLVVDQTLVAAFNKNGNTDFELFPVILVDIENNGLATVAPGEKRSNAVTMHIKSGNELVVGKTYLLPVAAHSVTEGVKGGEVSNMLLVRYVGEMQNAAKDPDIKIISCMEVNDANPLNNMEFTLKNSGKQLIDIVILFSGNINYNAETGRVYVNNNENVSAILNNREKYLKPLQDRGIKVVLGIMGNGDISGVANLADHTAREFARELKTYCDAYNLDGIFYDDEYSKYGPGPGFVSASNAAASRLVYETKRAMPDKLCMVYIFSKTSSLVAIDGMNPGQYIDFAIADYGAGASPAKYPGSTVKQMSPWSQQFNSGSWASTTNLTKLRNEGYGGHMIFAFDPARDGAGFATGRQMTALKNIASTLYDDELVWSGKVYPKDWN